MFNLNSLLSTPIIWGNSSKRFCINCLFTVYYNTEISQDFYISQAIKIFQYTGAYAHVEMAQQCLLSHILLCGPLYRDSRITLVQLDHFQSVAKQLIFSYILLSFLPLQIKSGNGNRKSPAGNHIYSLFLKYPHTLLDSKRFQKTITLGCLIKCWVSSLIGSK